MKLLFWYPLSVWTAKYIYLKIIKLFYGFQTGTCAQYICYLIWPRREDHHGIRCTHASLTSLFALEHLHWYWDGGDQYICWVARLPYLAFGDCGLSSPCSTVPCVLFCIFYYLNWIYNIWYELNENYYCEIVHASVCSLPLCIIIIIH